MKRYLLSAVAFATVQFAMHAEQDVLVRLQDSANLSGVEKIENRTQRIREVYNRLVRFADKNQKPIIEMLKNEGVEYKAFYIDNIIHIPKASDSLVARINNHPSVRTTFQNKTFKLVTPQLDLATKLMADFFDSNISIVKADKVWSDLNIRGEGIVIAGQDTGYDWQHPALKNQYRGFKNGSVDHNYNWHDAIHSGSAGRCGLNSAVPCDDSDHGTHTMGTMVGSDNGENQIGMAPNAKWIGCRNMNQGAGTPASYLECFEFFLSPYPYGGDPRKDAKAEMAPHIINNSWGCPASEGCQGKEFLGAVRALKAAGIAVVVAAGNDGPSCGTASDAPGSYSGDVFTVGSYNHWDDDVSSFSSRGPSPLNGGLAPEAVAPGHYVRSAVPLWKNSSSPYEYMSGTSMASPHIAGAIALLWSAKPELIGKVEDTFQAIRSTSTPKTSQQTCGKFPGSKVPNAVFGYGLLDSLNLINGLNTSWIDEKDIRIDEETLKATAGDITEQEFNALISKVKKVYAPIISKFGGTLSMSGEWENEKPNAYAQQMFTNWSVKITGGLGRRPELSGDGMQLVLCHELGHHLGGYAFVPPPLPVVPAWGANEGQSDYFATHVCSRRIWANQTEKNASFRTNVQPDTQSLCDSVWTLEDEQNLCYRTLEAARSVANTLAVLMQKPLPDFETPDSTAVDKINNAHPMPQCRMDTSLQGALCLAKFNEAKIPGKSASGGVTSVEAEREAAQNSCTTLSGYEVGLRPLCWYKPRM